MPHLTVAEKRLGDLAALQAADRALQPGLPLSVRVESLLLIGGTTASNSWRILYELPLATASAAKAPG